jgi:hypothetical protein
MEDSDIYFRRRAEEENRAAAAARTPSARAAHLELARLYGNAAEAVGLVSDSSSPWGEVSPNKPG